MERAKLSVAMIARNAGDQIGNALKSVAWADEICVADTGSIDNTKKVAEKYGAKTISIEFEGFGKARQQSVAMASHDWILALDSDEIVDDHLRASIIRFLENPHDYIGAEIPRVTNLGGKWIMHSGWYPEFVFRLFNKNHARFNDADVHESLIFDGRIRRLEGRLLHYSYPTLSVYLKKVYSYAELASRSRRKNPWILNLIYMLVKPLFVFFRKLIIQKGFADGLPGLWIAVLSAYGQFLRYYYALR